MSVSISQAHKNVWSSRYNKQNLFLIALVWFFLHVLLMTIPQKMTMPPEMTLMLFVIVNILIFILGAGFGALGINNVVHGRKNVLPNIFQDIGTVFFTGFKSASGGCLWFLPLGILGLAVILVSMGFSAQTPSLSIQILIIGLILYSIVWCITLVMACFQSYIFFISLNFEDWFNFKKELNRRRGNMGKFLVLILKLLLLLFITIILACIAAAIIGVITTLLLPVDMDEVRNLINLIVSAIASIAAGLIYTLYWIDLVGQFIRDLYPEKFKKKINQEVRKIKRPNDGQTA